MVVVLFHSRLREQVDMAALEQLGARMMELASAMPGFISYAEYAAPDGENLAVVQFESEESLLAWRHHPEHQEAQERGRKEFFEHYRIQVCASLREYQFCRE